MGFIPCWTCIKICSRRSFAEKEFLTGQWRLAVSGDGIGSSYIVLFICYYVCRF